MIFEHNKGNNYQRSVISAMLRRCQLREFPALDEFLRIILKVQHQNDFKARAALLAVLGGIAQHVAGKRSVANLLRRSLDSRDLDEQNAAIWASGELVKVDGEFSRATVPHIVQLLNDPALPLNLHSSLLSILGQCHSTAAFDVVDSLKNLIKGSNLNSPVASSNSYFAIDCCKQLTLLALRIPPVAELASKELAAVAIEDPRGRLRRAALKCLIALTKREVIHESSFQKILTILQQDSLSEKILAIRIINQAIINHIN